MKQKLLFLSIISFVFSFNGHSQWSLGDVAFSAYNAETASNLPPGTPVDAFTVVLLRDVTVGEQISFTERGWFSTGGFRAGENTATLQFTQNYFEGTQIIISADPFQAVDEFGASAGTLTGSGLSLATGGDQIFAYDPSNEPTAGDESGFIAAIHMNGDWNPDSTSSTTSSQPSVFTDGVNSISISPEVDNARFAAANCSSATDVATLRTLLNTASNWETNNSTGFEQLVPVCSFTATLSTNQQQSLSNAVSLTPNPVNDNFSISVANDITIDEVVLFNISGKEVMRIKNYASNTLINTSDLSSGMYIAKLYSGANIIVKKLIKQ